MEIIK